MSWLKGDIVRKQEDGSYAIENRIAGSVTLEYTDEDGDKSVITGSLINDKDVLDRRIDGSAPY